MEKVKNILIVFLILVVVYLCFQNKRDSEFFLSNIEILNDSISKYKLKNGNLVSERRSLQVTEKNIRNQLYIKDSTLKELVKKYRKIQSASTIETVTVVDSIFVRSERVDSTNFKFSRFHKYYSISGSYNGERLLIDSLVLPNTQNIVIGKKRGEITASVVNSNPYIKTTGMNTQVIHVPNRRFGIGVFGGVDVTGSPTVGVGVTFDFLRF